MLVTIKNFDRVVASFDGSPRRVVDTETTGLQVHKGHRVCGVSMRLPMRGSMPYYFGVRHEGGGNLPDRLYNRLVEDYLSDPEVVYTGWNYKFDIRMLCADGMAFPAKAEDLMLAAHLLNENEIRNGGNYKLKDWAERYIAKGSKQAELDLINLLADRGLGKGDMWRLAAWEVTTYASTDVDLTERARRFAKPLLRQWALWRIWQEVNEYMLATARMEMRGIKLDVPLMHEYAAEADRNKGPAYDKLCKLAGYQINPRSHPQIHAFLGMPSADREALEPLIGKNAAVDALLEYRGWDKVNNTYYRRYLEKMDENGILYPNIKLHGTVAGRPSAEDPNLQAVARKTKIYKVKDVFIARKGRLLVSADYSQAELRLTACVAKDRVMARVLNSGGDIHQATADLTGLERDDAKRINFGVVYGIGAPGLSKKIKKPISVARGFLDKWHSQFRRVKPAYRAMERQAKRRGYIRLWTGRVRRYFTLKYPEPHKALSNRIQGGVSEIMRIAITKLSRECYQPNGRMRGSHLLLQVHDQILFEVPKKRLVAHVLVIKEIMEDFPQFTLAPQKVDFKIGKCWGKAGDYAVIDGQLVRKDGKPQRLQPRSHRTKGKINGQSARVRTNHGAGRNGTEPEENCAEGPSSKSGADLRGSGRGNKARPRFYARRDGTVALIPE